MPHEGASDSALRLLSDIAAICNQNGPISEAVRHVLRRVCEHNGWFAGVAYIAPSGADLPVRIIARYVQPGRPDVSGILGALPDSPPVLPAVVQQVVERGITTWSSGADDRSIPEILSTSSVAIPVIADGDTVGVLQFVCDSDERELIAVKSAMESIGLQVGHLVARRKLLSAVARAADLERATIGRNLHDTVCQDLVGLALSADHLRDRLQAAQSPLADSASNIADGLRSAIRNVRSLLVGLLPFGPELTSLAEGLERLAVSLEARHGIICTLRCLADVRDTHTANELFFIAAEAATNAARHARATSVSITVDSTPEGLLLEVRDNGTGMGRRPGAAGGYGLSVMKHRAEALDGRLCVVSTPGEGTTVTCEVPYDEHRPDDRDADQGQAQGMADLGHR